MLVPLIGVFVLACAIPFIGDDYWVLIATRAAIYWVLISGLNLIVGFAGQLAIGWVALLTLGDDIDQPLVAYKRRIGRWLLWRAGPAVKADARYMAIDADNLTRHCTFRLFADGHGEGRGPDGARYERFRSWKEALRDAQ